MSAEPTWVIERAGEGEVQDLIALRREAEQWLADRGIGQWTPRWREVADEKARRAVRQERAWIVKSIDGVTVGTLTLGGPDEDLWHPQDGPALYAYKLMVARSHAGLGVGAVVLDWACTQAARWGYPWLRLDTWPGNTQLLNYYRDHGFSDVRVARVPGRDTGALMQRPALVTPTPDLVDAHGV